jgi:formylmethanofuran--tetrahydromethanopterin N-formyltransferase
VPLSKILCMSALPLIDDTFAEAFPMTATRIIITALDQELANIAAQAFCGNASSVIGCDVEAGIEKSIDAGETPDGRPGVSVLAFAFNRQSLEKAVATRIGQNVLTCPTTACYSGMTNEPRDKRIKLGALLRFFGDGYQFSKKLGSRRFWRLPVMDGEFLCEDVVGTVKGIGGGNLLICGRSQLEALAAVRTAVAGIAELDDVILPFPAGIVRSGSKVGSKYKQLKASTNHLWCPTLRGQTTTELLDGENAVYEIVIDGLSVSAVAHAMQVALEAVCQSPGVLRISAGNYGGKLGPHHFHLHRLGELQSTPATSS